MNDLLHELFEAQITLGDQHILWRELIGNLFGFASAIGGMRRKVWAWPVGIVGNLLLFTVFFGVWFTNPQETTLFGQASRQVFFIATSIYGWYRWREGRRRRTGDDRALTPRWATAQERTAYLVVWVAGVIVCQQIFAAVGAGWPAPRWYYWADAWIFVGSVIATFAMARGWIDFWLAWVAVDLVGVPLLLHSKFYPSAVLYAIYGALVIYGFVVWLRASKRESGQLNTEVMAS